MKLRRLIAIMATAVAVTWSVGAVAEEIALSLVHPKGRIEISVSAVRQIEAWATTKIRIKGTGEEREYPHPYVFVCFAPDVGERICELTRQIVDEPLAIVIDCEIVEKPIVREPLCGEPCFRISAHDAAEANALAERIRKGTNRTCAPSG
jgi:hypothetical protein